MRAIAFLFEKKDLFRSYVALMICLLLLLLASCNKEKFQKGQIDTGDIKPMSTNELQQVRSILYYGPETFMIVSREPVIAMRTIASQYFGKLENFVLKVQNGNDGNTRVSELEIFIDGILVVNYSDFAGDNHFVTKKLMGFTSNSVLEVRLDGSKGKFVNVLIDANLKPATITAMSKNLQ